MTETRKKKNRSDQTHSSPATDHAVATQAHQYPSHFAPVDLESYSAVLLYLLLVPPGGGKTQLKRVMEDEEEERRH